MKKPVVCPYCCPLNIASHVVKAGSYSRQCDGRRVKRFLCRHCKKNFSSQTTHLQFRQKKPHLLGIVRRQIVSGVARRKIAFEFRIHRRTVERKIRLLARLADEQMSAQLSKMPHADQLQFDEVETFEHTKCKPLSIPLVVTNERLILSVGLAQMPAKGHLAAISRRKYGYRADHRSKEIDRVLGSAKKYIAQNCVFITDKKTTYPNHLKKLWPQVIHKTTPGGRGAVTGYGEMKKKGFDPMFALNHTAAMFRDRLATLRRRTWTTTKKPENLFLLLKIYANDHNRRIAGL